MMRYVLDYDEACIGLCRHVLDYDEACIGL